LRLDLDQSSFVKFFFYYYRGIFISPVVCLLFYMANPSTALGSRLSQTCTLKVIAVPPLPQLNSPHAPPVKFPEPPLRPVPDKAPRSNLLTPRIRPCCSTLLFSGNWALLQDAYPSQPSFPLPLLCPVKPHLHRAALVGPVFFNRRPPPIDSLMGGPTQTFSSH